MQQQQGASTGLLKNQTWKNQTGERVPRTPCLGTMSSGNEVSPAPYNQDLSAHLLRQQRSSLCCLRITSSLVQLPPPLSMVEQGREATAMDSTLF